MVKKINKKQKCIIFIAIITILVMLVLLIGVNIIRTNTLNSTYNSANNNSSSSNLLPEYIKEGITLGGVTGTLIDLDTSDATATEEDILWGKTAYVKGEKITGTKIVTIAHARAAQKVFEKNITLIDDWQNTVVIPQGFKVSEDSATIVEDGIVIEDKNGNQFVWIPAKTGNGTTIHTTLGDKTIVYQRTDFGKQNGEYNDYTETLKADEEISVNINGGYYIGRYESGDKETTEERKMRQLGASTSNTITLKKAQAPYNYISQIDSIELAENMSHIQGYKGKTKLISSYGWDTAINFIQIKNPDYSVNSKDGNYIDVNFEYTDISGKIQTKEINTPQIIPTGQGTSVSNIYDMAGNLWEFTTEINNDSNSNISNRGGSFDVSYLDYPAGSRSRYNSKKNGEVHGFRVALYL